MVTLLILGRLLRTAATAVPRTSSGFSVFSEMPLVITGKAWTHDRSEHKLKMKLKDEPLLSLSAKLRYSSEHDHHLLTCGYCPSRAVQPPSPG